MLQPMFWDSDPKNEEEKVKVQFAILQRQDARIAEANYIKYNTATHLEELYRSQTFARSLYEYLSNIRNTDDKRTRNAQLKVLNHILRDVLPEDVIFAKNAEVTMEMYRRGLMLLNINFTYRDNIFNISIPDPSSVRREFFLDGDVWIEKAAPCIWHIQEDAHQLVASSMFPARLKEKFDSYIAERKING